MRWLAFLLLVSCGGSVTDDPDPAPEERTCVGANVMIPCSDGAPLADCARCPDGWLVKSCEGSEYVERCER